MKTKRIISIFVILVLVCCAMLLASCTNKKHNPVASKVVEPTCLTIGYTEYHCDHCDITYVADFADALGHSYTEENAVREADCTSRGIYESECERCGLTERRTVDAKGHSYIEISNDGEIVSYECENCYHLLTIGTEEDVKDYIGSIELFDVEASFSFDVLCEENEEYVREHLVLLDSYFIGSEYEYDAMLDYSLEDKGNGLWTVSLPTGFEHDTTYLAKPTGDVTFADYKGIELFFTVKDDPNHENVQKYNDDIVFLHALQQKNGGYYPYEVSAKEGESRIYVTVSKIDGLSKGQLLCVGEVTKISELTSDKECYFGIIDEFYEVADGKWVIVLSAPELQDIFDEFDVAFNEEINLENANINIEQLKADLVDSIYANDEFVEFLSAVNVSANEYLSANGYHSHNLDTIEKYLESVKINPSVSFNNNKLKAVLDGEITLDIEDEEEKNVGTLSVEFSFDIETKFKIDVNYEIRTSGFLGLNVNLDRFDIAITQSDKIDFDFGVSIDADGFDKVSYVKNKNSGEVHLACCVEVVRAADSSIFEVATADMVKSAEKKCAHCHPTGNESGEDNFKSYYISTLYCSDWSKVAQDISKLTQVKGDGAKANVKLTSVEIPLAMGVEIQLDLGFMLSLDPHALLDYSSTFSQTSTYGMRLNHNHLQPYSKTNDGEFRQDELAIVGQAQTKMGLSVDAFVNINGCEKWFRAGVKADVGAYADVSGVYDSNESYSGAYLEAGTFIDVNAYYKLFKAEDSADVAGATYPLMKYGYEKLYFGYDTYYDSIKILGSFDIDANDLLTVRYYDLVNMVVKTDELSLNERSKYRVNISFADGRYCEIRNGVIVYKTGAPEVFNDTLIITVISNDNWNSYKKGSAVYYIGTYTIDFEFDTNHRHTWVDATCTEPKHCEGCNAYEGNALGHDWKNANCTAAKTCTRCGETDGNALGHDWKGATCQVPKTCNRCGTTEGTTIDCIESGWIIDKAPTESESGTKHTECTMCGKLMNEGVVDAIASVGLKFTLNSGGQSYSVSGIGTCTDTDVVIPSKYEGLPVTGISDNAFENVTSFENVVIPDSVTSIGKYAFYRCTSLTSIVIPDSVTNIRQNTFSDCTSLTSVEIGDSVISIGQNAFSDCTSLTSVEIGDSVTNIGNEAFSACTLLTSVDIGDSVTRIGNYAFAGCSLVSIDIPDSVTSITYGAFYNCTSLTNIVIPDSVTSIGGKAFYNCTSLTNIVIPDSVTSICEYVFYGCTFLTSVEIGDSVTSIGEYAFYGCTSLTSIVIPNSVTSVGNHAFYNCTSLTSIEIPDSVTSIGQGAFRGCTSLTNIVISDSVTSIGTGAFSKCTSLTSIVIGNSVTSIAPETFAGCTSLTSIKIGNSVIRIEMYAFDSCTSLTSIEIPDSVTGIGNSVFWGCTSLASVEISDSLTWISESAFYGCTSLTSIVIPDSVKSIGQGAFLNCSSLISISIPNSVTRINSIAFYGCTSLTNINFEGTVAQWEAIKKELFGDHNIGSYTIYCIDGQIAKDGTVTYK